MLMDLYVQKLSQLGHPFSKRPCLAYTPHQLQLRSVRVSDRHVGVLVKCGADDVAVVNRVGLLCAAQRGADTEREPFGDVGVDVDSA